MSVREHVIELARGGMPPHLIERKLWGQCDRQDIYYWISKARRRDPAIPRFTKGVCHGAVSRTVNLPQEIVERLAGEAKKRGLTVRALVSALLAAAIRDNLVQAILDDGDAR